MALLPKLLIQFASLIFFHAAYSAWRARSLAKAGYLPLSQPFHYEIIPLPTTIVIELFTAFALLILGILWSATPLKKISWASEMSKRSINSEDSRLGFVNVRTRGSRLFAGED